MTGLWTMPQTPPFVSYLVTWSLGLARQGIFKRLSKCQTHNGVVHLRAEGTDCGLPHVDGSIFPEDEEEDQSGQATRLRLQSCLMAKQGQEPNRD